jgi:hypothetical protein
MLKTHPYYLSPPWDIWPYHLSWVVERQNNFDLSTIFLILHKFHIGDFLQYFSREDLMFLIWYTHVVHMVSNSSLRHILELPSLPNFNGLCFE